MAQSLLQKRYLFTIHEYSYIPWTVQAGYPASSEPKDCRISQFAEYWVISECRSVISNILDTLNH
jgi:hypothetical protein